MRLYGRMLGFGEMLFSASMLGWKWPWNSQEDRLKSPGEPCYCEPYFNLLSTETCNKQYYYLNYQEAIYILFTMSCY
jgi:hypothetical protein